jgi:HD superfamily phosphodiesterase
MNLTGTIESAEIQFKQILEEFFISVYDERALPSHGLNHHRRVWRYAKDFLRLVPQEDSSSISALPSQLIVACYLHDIGMTVDPGTKHGKQSRTFCSRFLANNNLKETEWQDVLEAIENHDNKNYTDNLKSNDLLTILSVSDDLDAFGCIGIYRYSEIYLTRKIEPEKIGHMIRENAGKRYENFIKIYGSVDEIVVKHWERYYLLDMFFNKYNEQLSAYQFGSTSPAGFCGVIELIRFIMENNLQLEDLFTEPEKYTSDPLILWYLAELEKELLA